MAPKHPETYRTVHDELYTLHKMPSARVLYVCKYTHVCIYVYLMPVEKAAITHLLHSAGKQENEKQTLRQCSFLIVTLWELSTVI